MNYFALSFRIIWIIIITILITVKISHAHPNHPPVPVLEITTDLTWSEDIRPIFREKCMNCHSPTSILPSEFSMSTYAGTESTSGARDWVYGIAEEVLTKRMPPWGADPRYNSFGNHRFLTQEEIETVVEWAWGGRPQGVQKTYPLPPSFSIGTGRSASLTWSLKCRSPTSFPSE